MLEMMVYDNILGMDRERAHFFRYIRNFIGSTSSGKMCLHCIIYLFSK